MNIIHLRGKTPASNTGTDYGMGQNAFTAVTPRSIASANPVAKKRGPRADGPLTPAQAKEAHNESTREWNRRTRNEAKTAKLLAFNKFNSHNFTQTQTAAKVIKVASQHFASV